MITASSMSNNTLTVIIDNSIPLSATKDHPKWAELVNAFVQKNEKLILELLSVKRAVERYTSGDLTVAENGVFYRDIPLHGIDVDRLLAFMRGGLPYQPIANYMARKFANPSARAVKEMYTFLEHQNMPLNDNGFIIAYKGVRDDYYSQTAGSEPLNSGKRNEAGQIFNGVGEVIEMPRNFVDDDFRQGCSSGLHAGSLAYARGFGSRMVLVEIDPADVVSVPEDCNCQKLRCCKYRVVGEYTGPLPDTYAPDLNSNSSTETTNDEEEEDDDPDDFYHRDKDWTGPATTSQAAILPSAQGAKTDLAAEVRAKFTKLVEEQLGIDPTEITDEKTFVEDFNCDSLDFVELTMAVEEGFGFEIPDGVTEDIKTFGEALNLLTKAVINYTENGYVDWEALNPITVDPLKEADRIREKLSSTPPNSEPSKAEQSDAEKKGLADGRKDGKSRYKRKYKALDENNEKDLLSAIYIEAYNQGYYEGRTDNKKKSKSKSKSKKKSRK
jgi:acyl carrier protein